MISNVQPCIPTATIFNELQQLDIVPVSPITTIKAGIHRPELGHLLSFRKQMFIKQEDIEKIPNNLRINHEGVSYWIYFSTGKLTCYICHEEGHLAKHCKPDLNELKIVENEDGAKNDTKEPPETTSVFKTHSSSQLIFTAPTPTPANKRPLSSSASST